MTLLDEDIRQRLLWFDEQPLAETGFGTLDPALWRPLLTAEGAAEPEVALEKLAVLATDDAGVQRATVAGVLLCTPHPERWLPNAAIISTRYRGADRTTGQVDAQEVTGALSRQIADAVTFAVRNMHVAARKTPARTDMPQYSEKAVFEAQDWACLPRRFHRAIERAYVVVGDAAAPNAERCAATASGTDRAQPPGAPTAPGQEPK